MCCRKWKYGISFGPVKEGQHIDGWCEQGVPKDCQQNVSGNGPWTFRPDANSDRHCPTLISLLVIFISWRHRKIRFISRLTPGPAQVEIRHCTTTPTSIRAYGARSASRMGNKYDKPSSRCSVSVLHVYEITVSSRTRITAQLNEANQQRPS